MSPHHVGGADQKSPTPAYGREYNKGSHAYMLFDTTPHTIHFVLAVCPALILCCSQYSQSDGILPTSSKP